MPTHPFSRSPLNRPTHFSDADWAAYQQTQAEHDDLMAQIADHEAQMEHDLLGAYDAYEFDSAAPARPEQQPRPATRTPRLRTLTPRRRNRGR